MTYRTDIEATAKFLQQGVYKRALKSALSAARNSPTQPVAPNLAGIALSATGRPNEAIVQFQKALKLQPDFADAQKNLAQTLILIGRGESAITVLSRTTKKTPQDWKVWALMAQAQGSIGQDRKARTSADTAIRLAPKHGPNYHLRSAILMRMGLIKDAIADLETALEINPADVVALSNLSLPLARQTRTQEALEVVRRAVELDPENLIARFRLATQLVEMGETEAAIVQYRGVLERAPDHPATLERLVEILPPEKASGLEKNIRSALKKVAKPSEDRASLLYALCKVNEALGKRPEAAHALAQANGEMGKLRVYDPEVDARSTRDILARYPTEISAGAPGENDLFPIFILGLPRSGTTLAEAILGRHPDVAPLGERGTLGFLLQETISENLPFSDADAAKLGIEDQRLLPDLAKDTRAYTDKMPENYRLVGMLKQVHPEARIIHITRDPRDIALSMWKAHFSGAALSYTYDLGMMAHKFNLYAETMAHWHRVLPGQILDVSYAEMVRDVEGTGRRMAAFCGLDWHNDMARPDQSTAQVMTLSATQLRQPVHTGSLGKWRQEAELLVPFIAGLDMAYWADLA